MTSTKATNAMPAAAQRAAARLGAEEPPGHQVRRVGKRSIAGDQDEYPDRRPQEKLYHH